MIILLHNIHVSIYVHIICKIHGWFCIFLMEWYNYQVFRVDVLFVYNRRCTILFDQFLLVESNKSCVKRDIFQKCRLSSLKAIIWSNQCKRNFVLIIIIYSFKVLKQNKGHLGESLFSDVITFHQDSANGWYLVQCVDFHVYAYILIFLHL